VLSTGLSTVFAALLGVFMGFALGISGFQALKAWLRNQFRTLEARCAELEAELDSQRATIRKVAGRMGAQIAQGLPFQAETPTVAERPHIPLAQVLQSKR
jgi:hypothetical protein